MKKETDNATINEESIVKYNKILKEDLDYQKKIIYNHISLFEEAMKSLANDKNISKKYIKRVDCLLRTTQIFICLCIILFSIVFFKLF
jgi:hypothetical protein